MLYFKQFLILTDYVSLIFNGIPCPKVHSLMGRRLKASMYDPGVEL